MNGQEFLGKLLEYYQSSFDIVRPFETECGSFDAYAAFNVTSAKYVLIKKAQLWQAKCYEHAFFSCVTKMDGDTLHKFRQQIIDYIEPELVRKGQNCTEKDHMYTYITGIFLCEEGISTQERQAVRKFRFFKNYRFGIRGYAEARLLVFDLKNNKIYGNRAAKELVKGYGKIFQEGF